MMVLQRLPGIACGGTTVSICYILYALVTPQGFRINTLSPQGVIAVLCVGGTVVSIYTCLTGPSTIKRLGYAIRPAAQIRRMNLLGLVRGIPAILIHICTYHLLMLKPDDMLMRKDLRWLMHGHCCLCRETLQMTELEGCILTVYVLLLALLDTGQCALQPEEVVQDLAANSSSASDVGWPKYIWNCLQRDIFAVVSKREELIQIHGTAEQFDPTTENLLGDMAVRDHAFALTRPQQSSSWHGAHANILFAIHPAWQEHCQSSSCVKIYSCCRCGSVCWCPQPTVAASSAQLWASLQQFSTFITRQRCLHHSQCLSTCDALPLSSPHAASSLVGAG